jgi:hypothetical protein
MRVSVPMSLPPSSYYLLHASYACIYIYLHTYLYTWVDVLIPTSNCQVCSVYSYSYLLVCLLACLSNFYLTVKYALCIPILTYLSVYWPVCLTYIYIYIYIHTHTSTYILPYIYIYILRLPVWLFNLYIYIRTYIYVG